MRYCLATAEQICKPFPKRYVVQLMVAWYAHVKHIRQQGPILTYKTPDGLYLLVHSFGIVAQHAPDTSTPESFTSLHRDLSPALPNAYYNASPVILPQYNLKINTSLDTGCSTSRRFNQHIFFL